MMGRRTALLVGAGVTGLAAASPAFGQAAGDRVMLPWQKPQPQQQQQHQAGPSKETLPWQAPPALEAKTTAPPAKAAAKPAPRRAAKPVAVAEPDENKDAARRKPLARGDDAGALIETGGNPPAPGAAASGGADDGWASGEPDLPAVEVPPAIEAAKPAAPEAVKAGEALAVAAPPSASPAQASAVATDVAVNGPAAGIAAKPEMPASLPEGAGATQQYCFNIADAARDARYAWQKKQLTDIEQEVAKRVAELDARTAEYKTWLARRDEFISKAEDGIVQIYAAMKPDAAAAQLSQMHEESAAAVLTKLNTRAASAILAEMEAAKAAKLTMIITGAAKVVAKANAPAVAPAVPGPPAATAVNAAPASGAAAPAASIPPKPNGQRS